jgi:cysteine desulfurase family protein
MVYFDNAATTFPKPRCVISELNKCLRYYCGNPGRSSHFLSLKAAEKIYECRENVAELLHYPYCENVVFTLNATYALNIAIKTTVPHGSHVIISDLEHNSVRRPLERMKNTDGICYSVYSTEEDLKSSIESCITKDTSTIISTLASNVTGKRIPLKILSDISRENGLKLIVDASQYIGHYDIDLSKTPCDVLCAPGHKSLFGIQGCGFLIICDKEARESFIEGGSGSDSKSPNMPIHLPDRFEAGTPSTPSIVSLKKGIDYIRERGIEEISSKIESMTEIITSYMSENKNIKLYGDGCGIVCFNYKDIPSSLIGDELSKRGVCVRSGFHCAPSAHRRIGTDVSGAVRISLSYLNSRKETDILFKVFKDLNNKY